jgi:glycosyltransferase involved in cell wall biosynthesis
MKIIYCIHATFNSGGMERVLTNKINYLVQNYQYEILIVTTEQKGRPTFFPLDPSVKSIDLNINYSDDLDCEIVKKTYRFLSKRRKHKKRLERILLDYQPDIVLSMFGTEASFLYRIKDNSRKILEIHFSKFFRMQYDRPGLWRFVDFIRSRMDEQVVRKYDRFVVLTNEDKDYWGDLGNIVVIPNFSKPFSNKISSLSAHRMITVGRLSYQKGYDRLIKAWNIVKKEVSDWELHIYGNGELHDVLTTQITGLGLSNDVIIHDHIKDIEDIYINASGLVLSSRYEGLPMVLLEAMSCGLPIISYDCKCGPKDVITNSIDGFLIEEGNIDELANKILLIISDNELRCKMGRNSKLKSELFSENMIMEKWIKLFDELIRN